ncbi:MAG: hypothetical protein AAGA48_39105, partial [Myxococcota bacterium]
SSVALIKQKLGAAERDRRLSEPLVRSLVQVTEGLPLALELAASKLEGIQLDDLVGRLQASLSLVEGGERRLTATVRESIALLREPARDVLAAAAWFPESFATTELTEVWGGSVADAIECVADIRRAALLAEFEGGWKLLDVVRAAARRDDDRPHRFVSWVVQQAREVDWEGPLSDPPPSRWVANLSAALDHATELEDRIELAIALTRHQWSYGNHHRGPDVLEGLLDEPLTARQRARVCELLSATVVVRYGLIDRGLQLVAQGLTCAEDDGDPDLIACLRIREMGLLLHCSDSIGFAATSRELLTFTEQPGVRTTLWTQAARYRAIVLFAQKRGEEAYRLLLQALARARGMVDELRILREIARIQGTRGLDGIHELEEAFALARHYGMTRQRLSIGQNLAAVYLNQGREEDSRKVYSELVADAGLTGQRGPHYAARIGLALLEPERRRAISSLEQCRAEALTQKMMQEAAIAGMNAGRLHHLEGRLEIARAAYEEALGWAETLDLPDASNLTRGWLALALAELGDNRSASSLIEDLKHDGLLGEARARLVQFVLARERDETRMSQSDLDTPGASSIIELGRRLQSAGGSTRSE